MRENIISQLNKDKFAVLFDAFLDEHKWSDETKRACTYSFFHTLNIINSNFTINNKDKKITFDNEGASLRSDVLDEAIKAIKNCELVAPNVRRIRVDSAVGALLALK